MKLFKCLKCNDVVLMITNHKRYCFCEASSGMYTDELNATMDGPCIPIGIDNYSLRECIESELDDVLVDKEKAKGYIITAFVIPHNSPTVEVDKESLKKVARQKIEDYMKMISK